MRALYFSGVVTAVCLLSQQGFCDQKITYQSKTSGKSKKTEWSLTEKKEGVSLKGKSAGSDINIEFSPDYTFLSYLEKAEPTRNYEIKREGPVLILSGRANGRDVNKSYKIGKDHWIQDFKFGLKSFLKEKSKELTFHLVSPKDFDIHEFVATKELEEVVEIEGKKYTTEKVRITLTGFKKKFWKAHAWFDKESHLLIRYRSNEGPGTPYTEVTILDKDHT
jgi:hypothetical protein